MNQKIRVSCLVLLAAAMGGTEAGAQGPLLTQPLDSGTLVQAHLVGGDRVRGRLLGRVGPAGDTIALCRYPGTPCAVAALSGREIVLPRPNVTRLEVAVGSRARRGVLLGSLSGLAATVVHYAVFYRVSAFDRSPQVVVGVMSLGAVLGAALGSLEIVWGPAP